MICCQDHSYNRQGGRTGDGWETRLTFVAREVNTRLMVVQPVAGAPYPIKYWFTGGKDGGVALSREMHSIDSRTGYRKRQKSVKHATPVIEVQCTWGGGGL